MIASIFDRSNLYAAMGLALFLISGGCAHLTEVHSVPVKTIVSGEKVFLEYTCRLDDGTLAVTTDPATGASEEEKKASIFLPMREPGPVMVSADDGRIQSIDIQVSPADFEETVAAYLAKEVIGKQCGKWIRIEIQGELQKGITESERYLKVNRHQLNDRRRWVDVGKAGEFLKKTPAVGDKIPMSGFPGVFFRITKIEKDRALTEVEFVEGVTTEHILGNMRMANVDLDKFDLVYDAEEGALVRSGSLVGRVIEVTEKEIILDYGKPFGGERLLCDVKASEK